MDAKGRIVLPRCANDEAVRLMTQFRDARRIHWYEDVLETQLRDGLMLAGTVNIHGRDGYYAAVARSEGVETILTLDDDFERVDGIACDVLLHTEQFETLNEYIDRL